MFRILKAVFLAIVVLNLNLGPAWAQSTEAGREQAIKDALARTPPPTTLPQEAERRFFRGLAAMKVASSVEDFESAAREFDMATVAAPWYADAYYNAGIAHNKAGNYSAARRNFSFYLLAAPAAPDTAEVKAMVYENEYLAEREETREQEQQRQQEATRRADEERHRVEQEVASVLGRWEWRCDTGTLPIRLLPSGTQSVVFEIWVEAAVSAWRGSRELQYDAALRRFVAGADSRNNGPMVIAVLDANQLLYSATSDGCTATCTLSR